MLANIREVLGKFGSSINDLYKQLVTTTAELDNIRRYTREAVEEFKRLLERQGDKIERIERDRIKAEAELSTKIGALQARLDAITEQTMRSAVSDYAKALVDEAALKRSQAETGPLLIEKPDRANGAAKSPRTKAKSSTSRRTSAASRSTTKPRKGAQD